MKNHMKGIKNATTLRWINHVVGGKKFYIGTLLLIQMILGISSVFYAMILRAIIDEAVAKNRQGFFYYIIAFVVLVVFQIILRAINRFLEEYSRATLENNFKSRLFSFLLNSDYSTVSKVHSGEWMNRLTSDTVVVSDALVQVIPGAAGMFVKMIGALITILILEPNFGYLLIPGGFLLVILTYKFRKVLKSLHKNVQESDGDLRVFIQENLSSMLVVRAFVKEEQTLKGACNRMEKHKKARMKRNHFSNVCNIGFASVMQGAYVVGAGFCGYGILMGTMSYGTLMAILQLINQVQSPFANITGYLPKYYAMIASAERIMEVEFQGTEAKDKIGVEIKSIIKSTTKDKMKIGLRTKEEIELIKGAKEKEEFEDISQGYNSNLKSLSEIYSIYENYFKSIKLENATFSYQSSTNDSGIAMPMVVKDVNIEIKKGEYIAFTGLSGCGKSTVLKLLMSLYPLDYGKRWIQLKDEKTMEEEYFCKENTFCKDDFQGKIPLTSDYRRLFAYVPQGNYLMSGTIREIVSYSDKKEFKGKSLQDSDLIELKELELQEENKIWRALKIACADNFVSDLTLGIDTLLGERGAGLSEGQMQRIAIARAIFSDNPILILDESTSALDEKTEKQLLFNLLNMTDKTVIIVTHRVEVLKICHKEIRFSEGNIQLRSLFKAV